MNRHTELPIGAGYTTVDLETSRIHPKELPSPHVAGVFAVLSSEIAVYDCSSEPALGLELQSYLKTVNRKDEQYLCRNISSESIPAAPSPTPC